MAKPIPTYPPPVDQLLTLGDPAANSKFGWKDAPLLDYSALGLTPSHAPDLIRLARDPVVNISDEPSCYAPVHAFRALAALGVVHAIPELVALIRRMDRQNDSCWLEDCPGVLALFGEAAIDPVARALRDQREPFGARLFLTDALLAIATNHPPARPRVVAVLSGILAYARYNDPGINGHIISALIDLSATESLPAIAEAYNNDYVDEMCCGPIEEVEAEIRLTADERNAQREARFARAMAEYEAGAEVHTDIAPARAPIP